jgi:acyl dehydratase
MYGEAVRSLLRRNRPSTVPAASVSLSAATVDRGHLAAYNRVCGFRLGDALPPTYPHIMAFPLTMRLMAGPDFPFPLVGIVHLANRITVAGPLSAAARWDFTVHAENLRPHDRGRQLDVVAVGTVEGVEAWRGVSTYLHRTSGPSGSSAGAARVAVPPPASATWKVPARVGNDYARVSGDHNPIHTSRLGARLLGYKRPIAHGMWSKARCLAALEGRLPDAFTVDVAFKRPILLPATVAFSATPGETFALHNPTTGAPHLTATLTS